MHYQDRCPVCERPRTVALSSDAESLDCSHCGAQTKLAAGAYRDGQPVACIGCGNADLWRQKDFPRSLGLLMVALGAVLSSIAWGYHYPVLALSILGGFALIDMVLYWVMPDVLVCYRCGARHRVAEAGEQFVAYNHELGERYRQERLRLEDSAGQKAAHHGA